MLKVAMATIQEIKHRTFPRLIFRHVHCVTQLNITRQILNVMYSWKLIKAWAFLYAH